MRKAPAVLAFLVVVLAPLRAPGQTAPSVTLEASATRITVGERVTFSGSISTAAADETVVLLDHEDAELGRITTNASGDFDLTLEPTGTLAYRAVWGSAASGEVTVRVRASVEVAMSPVRLFDEVTVRGTVEPPRSGGKVDVVLARSGHMVQERRVAMGAAGGFRATFRVPDPGTYRARASFSAADLVRDSDVTDADTTPLPSLRTGSRGVFVALLEQRLVELAYRLVGPKDSVYDARTADAVVAFHKVQGMNRVFTVSPATWHGLADPKTPRPAKGWKGFHLEVDQTRQVLYTVEDGQITNILHVSSGKPSTPTRDGIFHVVRKIAGFSPNHLYYPSYFDGNRALHGWTEVPTYAASHGCVRIPYWNAIWVYGLADFGTRVVVYH